MDDVFEQEQAHLSETYAQLLKIRDELTYELDVKQKAAAADLKDMSEEVRPDFVGVDETMETLAAIETLNSVIDAYNLQHDLTTDKLRRTLLLLAQPYFAKVSLVMRSGEEPREIYIGTAGITDNRRRPVVVDWRSPVAETYYNQENGPTAFYVDGRRRDCTLTLRRQFDITRDVLKSYFDTTVAIEDSLLLAALKRHHSPKLRDITATIQREQNVIVRHGDVPALLVNGIAGSGKTSVMLQRIAFLFYQERETLSPDQVVLFSPNEVFESYIDRVLPSLGEANPETLTWQRFVDAEGLSERSDGRETSAKALHTLERAMETLALEPSDVRAITAEGRTLLKQNQVASAMHKFSSTPVGPRFAAQVTQELHERLDRAFARLAKTDEIQEEMLSLDIDAQMSIFDEVLAPDDEDETIAYARRYVESRYAAAHEAIERAEWLRYDRIGMRVLGTQSLSATEYLYLKLLIVGSPNQHIRFVMVDEVQDYTPAQLMVLARAFSHAHFLLLGDEHQAIQERCARFSEIHAIFESTHGSVEECFLRTSYRSSPEVTRVFSTIVGDLPGTTTANVQREGGIPEFVHAADTDAYFTELTWRIEQAQAEEGLTAILVADRGRAKWISRELESCGVNCPVASTHSPLPAAGVVIIDLMLAKGLEFDHVIIADATEEAYPESELSRRRLYTAVSRAMHRVSFVVLGTESPLLTGLNLAEVQAHTAKA